MYRNDDERRAFELWERELQERPERPAEPEPRRRPDTAEVNALAWGLVTARIIGDGSDVARLMRDHIAPLLAEPSTAAQFVRALTGITVALAIFASGGMELEMPRLLSSFALADQVLSLPTRAPDLGRLVDEIIDAADVVEDPNWRDYNDE